MLGAGLNDTEAMPYQVGLKTNGDSTVFTILALMPMVLTICCLHSGTVSQKTSLNANLPTHTLMRVIAQT